MTTQSVPMHAAAAGDPRTRGMDGAPRWSPDARTAVAVFAVLTIVYTFPAAFELGRAVPGRADGDTLQYLWNLWWVKTALLDLHQSPFWTDYLYYPYGASLLFHSLAFGLGLLALPLTVTIGAAATYTVVVFGSFVLSGLGVFLLVRHMSGSGWGALVGGFVFAFTPYHFAHLLGHLDLSSIQWLALYALCLVRSLDGSARWAPWSAGVFFALAALTSWNYGFFLAVFSPILICGFLLFQRGALDAGWHRRLAVAGAVAAVLLAPIVVSMIAEITQSRSQYMVARTGAQEVYSADLLTWITPSWLHPVWDDAVLPLVERFSAGGAEGVLFLGFGALALAAVGVRACGRTALPWLLAGVASAVLALGPSLRIAGEFARLPDGQPLPLPYQIFLLLPAGRIAGVPARFGVLTALCCAVLAGLGFAVLARQRRRLPLAGAAVALVVFEFWPGTIEMTPLPAPPDYVRSIAESGDAPVVDIPVSWRWQSYPYMYLQTFHGQPIVGGFLARQAPYDLLRSPVLRALGRIGWSTDIVDQDVVTVAPSVFAHYGLRWAVFHLDELSRTPSGLAPAVRPLLEHAADLGTIEYRDEHTVVVRLAAPARPLPFLEIGEDWYDREEWEGTPVRWLAEQGTIEIVNTEPTSAELRFDAGAFGRPRTLEIVQDGTAIARLPVGESWTMVSLRLNVPAGRSRIVLRPTEPPESPRALGVSLDPRPLAVAVRHVRLTVDRTEANQK